jgi:hypothetical protein
MDLRYEGLTGEPDALKGASPVRRGAVGKGLHRQYLAGRLPYFAPWNNRAAAEQAASHRAGCWPA